MRRTLILLATLGALVLSTFPAAALSYILSGITW